MTRKTDEWIATHDDQAIPARVKIRVFDLFNGNCAICTGRVTTANYDHAIALVNGGAHRESNLQLLCVPCHKGKTKADVAEKSITARKRAKHLGIKKPRDR
jgi:5-methylcytosine-specific restriction protein A